MQKPDRSTYTPLDFLQWRETKALVLTPKFQRRGVWSTSARSFFIDTLLRQMPVPPVYIRVVQATEKNRVVREVVDGQQRVSAILDFIDGKYRLSRSLDATWSGKSFEKLNGDEQRQISGYAISAEVFQGISDLEVLEIFSRLNTYSVPLNAQELRNGRYFGFFKKAAYSLAYEHLEFWRKNGIFTERNIARMLEVELVSEFMVAILAGMQDKKKTIDSFYDTYNDDFKDRAVVEKRLRDVFEEISETFDSGLSESEFRRPPLFYTLFCTVLHHRFGLPKATTPTPKKSLSVDDRLNLRAAIDLLSDKIRAGRAKEPVAKAYSKFVTACLSQTDNIGPRQERFTSVWTRAFE